VAPTGAARRARPRYTPGPLLVALLFLLATPARSHELGIVEMQVELAAGRYSIELPVDPLTALQRLELAAGGNPTPPGIPPAEVRRRLEARRGELAAAVDIHFDGVPSVPQVGYEERGMRGGEPIGFVRWSGEVPPGAATLQVRQRLNLSRYAIRVTRPEGEPEVVWVDPDSASPPLALAGGAAGGLRAFARYVWLGFTHIVPLGIDHVLFVLGIFLLSARLGPLLAQVTAFTIAHSLTLGLAMYGVVSLPAAVVEPLIALSIVYVAVENVLGRGLGRFRLAVVFAFGLLHGLGFAGVLSELGLPRGQFLLALLGFNVGVELGQLAVIAAAFVAVFWWRRRDWYQRRVVVPASLVIAAFGLFWAVQRLWPE
jgi:hypothetical protein